MRLGKGHRWGDNAGGHDAHPTYTSLSVGCLLSVDHLGFMKYELFWAWTAWSTSPTSINRLTVLVLTWHSPSRLANLYLRITAYPQRRESMLANGERIYYTELTSRAVL